MKVLVFSSDHFELKDLMGENKENLYQLATMSAMLDETAEVLDLADFQEQVNNDLISVDHSYIFFADDYEVGSFVITPFGQVNEVLPKNGKDFELSELQGFVEGYIEIVDLGNGRVMVANENGYSEHKLFNAKATEIIRKAGRNEDIVGSVLVCNSDLIK